MVIYQIHAYSGEWEDFRDCIVGSYLRKGKAEQRKIELEAEEKKLIDQSEKCNKCPYLYDSFIKKEELLDYCPKAKLENSDYGVDCANYYQLWDETTYKIEEIEVEE